MQLSQEQLATAVNYSTIAIRKLESNDRPCSEALALVLIDALNVPAELSDAFLRSAQSGIVDPVLQSLRPAEDADSQNPKGNPHSSHRALIQYADPVTQLFGRENEIAQVLEMLQQPFTRLITLLGPPGVGKSRLGLALLEHADSANWPDGRFFVPLTTINHATLIPQAIAAVISLEEINARKWRDIVASQSVFRFIKDKRALLVLDNFEHLPEGVAFISELLIAAPLIKVIVTSQVSLRVSNEQVYRVNPLPVPERVAGTSLAEIAQMPTVRLFVARAQSRRPSFKLTDSNASTIIELCRHLDGLPLALELAAVRLKLQTPEELLAQFNAMPLAIYPPPIERSTALQWPRKGVTDMPKRHQSLFAALSWSYNLLPADAQIMFEQLGVLQGSFTRDAAITITQGSLEALEALAGQSLIQVQVTSDDRIRLSLLQIFREFALMKLEARGAVQETSRRHAQYFADVVKQVNAGLRGLAHMEWLARMELDTPNVRAALQWCVDHDPATGCVLATHLVYYWYVAGHHQEGWDWVEQILQAGEDNPAVSALSRAYLRCEAVVLHFEASISELEAQLALFQSLGDAAGIALAQTMLGMMFLKLSPAEADRHLTPAIEIYDALGDAWSSARACMLLAISKYRQADYAASERLLNKTVQSQTQLQDVRSLARTYNHLSWLAFVQGQLTKAAAIGHKALLMNQQFKDNFGVLQALNHMAFTAMELNDLDQVHTSTEEGLRLIRETGSDFFQAPLLLNAGALAQAQGRLKDACQYYVQSIAFAEQYAQTDHVQMNLIQIAQLLINASMNEMTSAEVGNFQSIAREIDPNHILIWLYAVQTQSQISGYQLPQAYQKRLEETRTHAAMLLGATELKSAWARGEGRGEGRGEDRGERGVVSWEAATLLARSAAEIMIIGINSTSRPVIDATS